MDGAVGSVQHALDTGIEGSDARAFEPLEDLVPALLAGDDAGVPENGQVARDGGHVGVDSIVQIGHAPFARAEGVDDGQPGRMPQRFEDVGAGFEQSFSVRVHGGAPQEFNSIGVFGKIRNEI